MKVHIVQPSVAPYRQFFFEYLDAHLRADLYLYTSPVDELESRSVTGVDVAFYDPDNRFIKLPLSTYFQIVWPRLRAGDVLVINGNPRMLSNYLLIAKARLKRVPVIWWGHGWSSTSRPWRAKVRRILTRLLSDAVLLYTDHERDRYIEDGFLAERVFALNNGVNTTLIKSLHSQALKKLTNSEQSPVSNLASTCNALFIGRLTRKSGIDTLVEHFTEVDQHIGLIIVGAGELEDTLLQLIDSLNLSDRIIMVGAAYEEQDIAFWMAQSHLFVYPGPVGLSVVHALAYALPVVIHANYCEHGPEAVIVKDGINGLVFDRGNTASMIESVNRLASHEYREQMGHRGRDTVTSTYSFSVMASRFSATVDFALALKSKP